jgi:hypothetical protein
LTKVDPAVAAVLVTIYLALIAATYKLSSARQDLHERWDSPLRLAKAAADDRALTALERLAAAVSESGITGGLAPLVDPRDFREAAAAFLREVTAQERLLLIYKWLLRAATATFISALASAIVGFALTYVVVSSTQGFARTFVFALTGLTIAAFALSGVVLMLLQGRLAAISGRAES